jgi:hypothetical protein
MMSSCPLSAQGFRKGPYHAVKHRPVFRAIFATALLAALSAFSFGQHNQPDVLKAMKTRAPIKLDGILDEADWAKAPRISNFTQRELNENMPATEKTEVAVLYTATEMYIGIWCYDSEPDKIIAQKMKWDFEYGNEDNFEIALDTYGDKRNAYLFIIKPNGAQYDALVTDNSKKLNADGIYQGEQTPILGGARFLGKMGGTTLGIMVLQTENTDTAKATNFSLVRYKQDLGEQSSIGALAIGAAQSGRFNGTGGVDALYSTSKLFGNKNSQIGGAYAAIYQARGIKIDAIDFF